MKTMTAKSELMHNENFIIRWFNGQVSEFETSHFGRMVIFLTLQSCVGSIACMLGIKAGAGDWALILGAAITMTSNAMFIAQTGTKLTLLVFYASLIINTALIIAFV